MAIYAALLIAYFSIIDRMSDAAAGLAAAATPGSWDLAVRAGALGTQHRLNPDGY